MMTPVLGLNLLKELRTDGETAPRRAVARPCCMALLGRELVRPALGDPQGAGNSTVAVVHVQKGLALMAMMKPKLIRVTMARRGLAPDQLTTWWSPDTERDVRPLDTAETQAEVKSFMAWLWGYCLEAEAKD